MATSALADTPLLVGMDPLAELLGQAWLLYHDQVEGTSNLGEAVEAVLASAGATAADHPLRVRVEKTRVELQLEEARAAADNIRQLELEQQLIEKTHTTAIYELPEWIAHEEAERR